METHGTVFYEERKVCNRGQARYRTELANENRYPLDNGFVADVCKLPTSYDESTYMEFLDTWGTVGVGSGMGWDEKRRRKSKTT